MQLTSRNVIALMLFYSALIVASSVVLFQFAAEENKSGIAGLAGCIASSVLGASISYTRKIYRTLFDSQFADTSDGQQRARRYATLIYFGMRPVFATAIGFGVYFLWHSGLDLSISGRYSLSNSGFFLIWAVSMIAGFNTGAIIDVSQIFGEQLIRKAGKDLP